MTDARAAAAPAGRDDSPYDALETRSPDARDAALASSLPTQIAHAKLHAPAVAERLRDVDPASITNRAALAHLPVLRKHELFDRQKASAARDVFGGFSTIGWGAARPAARRALRVFSSPGPIHEPDAARPDYWRMARALHAAGFRAGDLVHNSFSYHFTPAGAMMESGAHAIGCTVFPAGTGQSELQLLAMTALAPDDFADLAVADRIARAGANDLDDHALVDDQAVASLRFVGDQAEVGRAVALIGGDAARREPLAKSRWHGLAAQRSPDQ